jgi:uncharacterized protein YneF (UPF0154 family)
MHIISSFEHSAFLELAINHLQEKGIEKEDIVAVPLQNMKDQPKLFDTIHRSDGESLLDLAAILGTVFSVLGASFGFVLTWGPIIWGLLGLAFGAIIGFLIDYLLTQKRIKRKTTLNTEVILIVSCKENEYETVKRILFENRALGVGKLRN